MRHGVGAKSGLFAGIAVAAAALLALILSGPGSGLGSARSAASLRVEKQPARVHRAVAPSGPCSAVAPSKGKEARSARRREKPPLTADGALLQSSVLDLDRPDTSVTDLQDLGSTLTRLLSLSPELGLAAAGLLEELKERKVLFQVSHALRAVVGDPAVEASILDVAASPDATDAQREAALKTLGGRSDPEAIALCGNLAADDACPSLTRSAAFYELSVDAGQAPAGTLAAAADAARSVLAAGPASDRVGAAALDLLGAAGMSDADRTTAYSILDAPATSEACALAAARALLLSGADRSAVAASLQARVAGDPAKQAVVALLDTPTQH